MQRMVWQFRPPPPRAPRAPSLRTLVKLAVQCQSVEEFGEKLKRRYERQKQRQRAYVSADPANHTSTKHEAELGQLLGKA